EALRQESTEATVVVALKANDALRSAEATPLPAGARDESALPVPLRLLTAGSTGANVQRILLQLQTTDDAPSHRPEIVRLALFVGLLGEADIDRLGEIG